MPSGLFLIAKHIRSLFKRDRIYRWAGPLGITLPLYLDPCRSDSDQLHPSVLDSLDVEGIVTYIREGRAKNIVTMAGAGISTTAGGHGCTIPLVPLPPVAAVPDVPSVSDTP